MGNISAVTVGQKVRVVKKDHSEGGGYDAIAVGDTGTVTGDAGDGRVFVDIDGKPMPIRFLGFDWPMLADELEAVND